MSRAPEPSKFVYNTLYVKLESAVLNIISSDKDSVLQVSLPESIVYGTDSLCSGGAVELQTLTIPAVTVSQLLNSSVIDSLRFEPRLLGNPQSSWTEVVSVKTWIKLSQANRPDAESYIEKLKNQKDFLTKCDEARKELVFLSERNTAERPCHVPSITLRGPDVINFDDSLQMWDGAVVTNTSVNIRRTAHPSPSTVHHVFMKSNFESESLSTTSSSSLDTSLSIRSDEVEWPEVFSDPRSSMEMKDVLPAGSVEPPLPSLPEADSEENASTPINLDTSSAASSSPLKI